MYLDKDDLGYANDIVKRADGTVTKVNINREVVTIRGIIAGEYVINAHYYSSREWSRLGQLTTNGEMGEMGDTVNSKIVNNKDEPLTVKIELHKVTPYKILWVGEKKFHRKGQEESFVRFTIDKDGELLGDFEYEDKKFVVPYMRSGITAPDIIEDEPDGATRIGTHPNGADDEPYSERGW